MKKITTVAVVAILLFSCQKAQDISNREKTLPLTAPSGQSIAESVAALKAKTAKAVIAKTGEAARFEMVSIDYYPVKKGYAAVITFQLADGRIGSYLLLAGVRSTQMQSSVRIFLNDNWGEGSRADQVGFLCVKRTECATDCYTRPSIVLGKNGEFENFDCGCSGNCDTKEVQ